MKISLELLSEVLNADVYSYYVCEHKLHVETKNKGYIRINIYELAHKCKVWGNDNKYYIQSMVLDDGSIAKIIMEVENKTKHITMESSSTEPEAIFKACQYILDTKRKNHHLH